MRHLVIGMGQIGEAVSQIFSDAQTIDMAKKAVELPVDVMHICFPYSDYFVQQVSEYAIEFKPNHVIIWSTVAIGTTRRLMKAVHSPVEGKHPDLELSIRHMERWVGYNIDEAEKYFYINLFNSVGINVKPVANSDFTEALKLLSTTEYGINIAFARYKQFVAEALEMDYELVKDWNLEYNKLYKNLGLDKKFQKFVLEPGEGPIGGHCVLPNLDLLEKHFPSDMLGIIRGTR